MLKLLKRETDVESTDHVVIYPTFGHLTRDGSVWRIDVYGTVYEASSINPRKRLLLRLLQRVAKVQPNDAQRELFESRIREFIAPTYPGKRVALRVGEQVYPLQKRTKRNGRFQGSVRLSTKELDELHQTGDLADGLLRLDVLARDGEATQFNLNAHLLDHRGVSVISDIDDTIKVTDVHSRRALLQNTFLREFETIDGMSGLYQRWAQQGAAFHYVSSSPWQLYASLAEMCETKGFPCGSFHLRSFRLRDHMLRRLLLIRRKGKAAVIRNLLKTFPRRQFIFVGDSVEKDPEIYGRIARKYPHQVAAICIRQIDARPIAGERLRKTFRDLPEQSVRLFECPSELPDDLGLLVSSDRVTRQA